MTNPRQLLSAGLVSAEARLAGWTIVLAGSASLFALLSARWLDVQDRGVVVVFLTTSSLLMLVGSMGTATGARVLLNRAPPLGLDTFLHHARLLSLIHLLTTATVGVTLLALSNGMPRVWVAILFIPYAVLTLFSYLSREALHGLGKHEAALLSDVIPSVVQVAAVVLLHATGRLDLPSLTAAILCSAFVQASYLTWRIGTVSRSPIESFWTLNRVIRFSFPALFTALGQAVVIRVDRLILGALAGTGAVGIYGAAATLTEVLWLVPSAVAQLAFRRASVTNRADAGRKSRQIVMGLTLVFAAAFAVTAHWIIPLLLGPRYVDAIPLSYILVVAAVPMASYQLDVAVINGMGRLASSGCITVTGSLVLAIGCIATIPFYGAFGAAWASLVAYSIEAIWAKTSLRGTSVLPMTGR